MIKKTVEPHPFGHYREFSNPGLSLLLVDKWYVILNLEV